jgi:hypothetical protein
VRLVTGCALPTLSAGAVYTAELGRPCGWWAACPAPPLASGPDLEAEAGSFWRKGGSLGSLGGRHCARVSEGPSRWGRRGPAPRVAQAGWRRREREGATRPRPIPAAKTPKVTATPRCSCQLGSRAEAEGTEQTRPGPLKPDLEHRATETRGSLAAASHARWDSL